jgi:membrane protein YqaA with SNARE-associated domain
MNYSLCGVYYISVKTVHEKLKAWLHRQAQSRHAGVVLGLIALAEASFFPIPPDIFLLPLVMARREKWWQYATMTSLGSVLGGVLGYVIGLYLFSLIGEPLIDFYGLEEQVAQVGVFLHNNAFWGIFISAFTPIPFKVFTITAGAFQISLAVFILAAIIGRSLRFFLGSFLMYLYGERIGKLLFKYLNIASIVFVVLIVLLVLFL